MNKKYEFSALKHPSTHNTHTCVKRAVRVDLLRVNVSIVRVLTSDTNGVGRIRNISVFLTIGTG
jgi:hypothetical protein